MKTRILVLVGMAVFLSVTMAAAMPEYPSTYEYQPSRGLYTVAAWTDQSNIFEKRANGEIKTVASEPNTALMPSFSKDGSRVAYVSTRFDATSNWWLSVVVVLDRTTGESNIVATADPGKWMAYPKFDRGCRRLAVLNTGTLEVWNIADIAKSYLEKEIGENISSFDWWDNYQGFFFTQMLYHDGPHGVFSQDLRVGDPETITGVENPDYDYENVIAAGNRLCFNRRLNIGGDWELYYRDLDADEPEDVLIEKRIGEVWLPVDALFAVWDPLSGGKRLFYHNFQSGYLRVFALDLESGYETVVSPEFKTAFYPAAFVERVKPVQPHLRFGRRFR